MSDLPFSPLTLNALKIWQAGVSAVDSTKLVADQVQHITGGLQIAGTCWRPSEQGRLCVVGAGKAGTGMASGLENRLGPEWLARTSGWVNVPDDCVRSLQRIHLHGARPAGVNEPTAAGVKGTEEILRQVSILQPSDLCLVLISGGGSALLPAPRDGLTLDDKRQVTRSLMKCGADIAELNTVRRSLSKIKGGGLLRACRAGKLITLIISDVIGDPLETIASGPTVPTADFSQAALEILQYYIRTREADIPAAVMSMLQHPLPPTEREERAELVPRNVVIGNNRTAVQAATNFARELGYEVVEELADQPGRADSSGRSLAQRMARATTTSRSSRICFVSGGETTVDLSSPGTTGKGGRNQEFALSALHTWLEEGRMAGQFALVSGGTDGEDGPTDAAGACVDNDLLKRVSQSGIHPASFLRTHDSYTFFERCRGLLRTGPTHTNVMDLRIGLMELPTS